MSPLSISFIQTMGVDEKHLPVQSDGAVQTAQHGSLHPQPTSDPLDPLNWSAFQKNSILGIVMLKWAYHSPFQQTHTL